MNNQIASHLKLKFNKTKIPNAPKYFNDTTGAFIINSLPLNQNETSLFCERNVRIQPKIVKLEKLHQPNRVFVIIKTYFNIQII